MEEPDFIPKDEVLCQNCVYKEFCPYDYVCKTGQRYYDYYQWCEDLEDVRDGDSTEKVR